MPPNSEDLLDVVGIAESLGLNRQCITSSRRGMVLASVAAAYAIRVTRDVLGQGMQTSLRAYRFARAEKER